MTEPTPVSVVLVGYGLGGRVFHAPLISTTSGLALDAIVTRDPVRREQAQSTYPAAVVYESVDQAWAAGHDLAAISTANVTHVPYAYSALAAGLHVVLDKPITATARDAVRLAETADAAGRLLIPFQNRRWDSDFLTALALAESGAIGEVHRFESRIERMRVLPKGGWRDSADPTDMGGMIYDLGAHVIDQALQLMGPVTSVFASARTVRAPAAVDDDSTLVLEHRSGAISLLVVSQVGAFADPRIVLHGTRGGLRIDHSDSQEQALVAGRLPGPDWGEEPADTAAVLRLYDDASAATQTLLPLARGNWPYFYAAVERAVRGSGQVPVPVDQVIANLRVMDAARESASSGSVIRLDPEAGHRA